MISPAVTPDQLNGICIGELKALNLSEYVVVVGSGPSNPYIAPSKDLRDKLCARCGIVNDATKPFWMIAQDAFDTNQSEYYAVIRESYGSTPYWQSRTYTHIASIPFRGYVTFNYDDQLPSACQHVMGGDFVPGFTVYPPRAGQKFADASDFFGIHRQVFPVHGYSDPENLEWHKQIILKTSDYDVHYTDPASNNLFRFWKNLLLMSPCVFVGTSLEEPGLYKVVEDLRATNPLALERHRHLHLIPSQSDPLTKNYPPSRKSLGAIEQLRFDRIDERYTGLIQILGALSGLPTGSPSPNAPPILPISATSTFTFYTP